MWRRVRLELRQARAVYHLLVPRQLPNGVIPWRTPILTLTVWTPLLVAIPAVTGAPRRDVEKAAATVAVLFALIWVGRVRHWVAAYLACHRERPRSDGVRPVAPGPGRRLRADL